MNNRRLDFFINKAFEYRNPIIGFLTSIVLITVVYSLNKGLIFSDESWYLLHLRVPDAAIPYSQWYAYALKLFPKGILSIRIVTITLLILSGCLFTIAISKNSNFTKQQSISTCIIGLFVLYMPVQFVPNYMTFNAIILFVGSGMYILAISSYNKTSVFIYSTIAGIVFSQLLFVMITNMAIYGVLIILPFLIQKRNIAITNVLALIIGSILGFLIFFICIKSFDQFYNETLMAFKYHDLDESHGIKDLIKWSVSTFTYIIKEVMLPGLLLLIIKQGCKLKLNLRLLTIVILALYFIVISIVDIRTNLRNITPPTIIFSIAFFIMMDLSLKKNYRDALIGLFCFSIPFFGCIGTDVSFSIRASFYILPILVFIMKYVIVNSEKKILLLILFFLLFAVARYSIQFINSSGWNGYVLAKQEEPLKKISINESINLDLKRFNTVKEFRSIISPGTMVLVSHHNLWGYVYLSEAITPLLQFKFNKQRIEYYFKNHNLPNTLNKLALIEDTKNPFPNGYIESLGFKNNIIHRLNSNPNIKVYILTN